MKILFALNRAYLPQSLGGSEWSTHHLCVGLCKMGHEVSVVCELRQGGWLALRNGVLRKLSGKPMVADRTVGYPVFRGWNAISGLTAVVRDHKPDVVVLVGVAGNGKLALAASELSIPLVYFARDTEFDRHGEFPAPERMTFVANSSFTAARIAERFGACAEVVLPPIDCSKCRVDTLGSSVLLINPSPNKGGELALRIAEAMPNVPFVFRESWAHFERKEELRSWAERLQNVQWKPAIMSTKAVYQDARILLAPSQRDEAWGRVASEAHCSGIPVIGSRIGGLTEAIGPGGIVLERDAPVAEWVAAVDSLWSDTQAWALASKRAREYAERLEIDACFQVSKFVDLLSKVVGNGN